MLNGNVNEFVDRIYTCQDTVFIHKGRKYSKADAGFQNQA